MDLPRWVVINIYSVYRAVIVILIPRRMIVRWDHENMATDTNNSPIKLMDGGRARLVRLAMSHQAAIRGRIICRPRARIIVRLWVRS